MSKKMDDATRYDKLREAVGNGDVDRRTFFGLLGSAGITAGLSGGIISTSTARQAAAASVAISQAGSRLGDPASARPTRPGTTIHETEIRLRISDETIAASAFGSAPEWTRAAAKSSE